jgi:two-component system cell cycle sensor histidine kinase/response regulator CckA
LMKAIETMLPEDEKSYRTLAENIPGMVYRVFLRENNRMQFFNKRLEEVTGYRADELPAGEVCSIDPLIIPEDRVDVVAAVRQAVREDRPFEVAYRLRHRDGDLQYVLEKGRPIRGEDGQPLFIDGVIIDVTDRERAEETLRKTHTELEALVKERTAELAAANEELRREIDRRRQTEEALRESEQGVKAILDASPDMIFRVDTDFRVVWANKVCREMNPEAIGSFCYREYPGKEEVCTGCPCFAALQNGLITTGTMYHPALEGLRGESYWENIGVPLRDDQDRIIGAVEIARNITQREKAEQALRKNEEYLRLVLNSLPHTIFHIDRDFRVLWANKGACDLNPDAVGRHCYEAYACKEEICQECTCLKAMETGEIAAKTVHHPSVEGIQGESYWEQLAIPLGDDKNEIVGALEVSINVTERKKAEEALGESEYRYRTLFNSASDMLFIHDLSGAAIDFNATACERLGYRREELLRMKSEDIDTAENARLVAERINRLRQTGSITFETAHKTRDGRAIPTEVSSQLIDYQGKPAVLSIGRDISERKKAEEQRKRLETQLLQARKMEAVGTLAGGIAHDFNNLLMGILGNVSLLLLDVDPRHPSHKKLKTIEQYVQSGAHLTEQLLGFARGGRYVVEPTDPNRLVVRSLEMFARAKKEIAIHSKYQQDISTVEVDQGQIEQVMLNLYINAWQAMPGGGNLFVQTEDITMDADFVRPYAAKPGEYVRISVTDTGVGMDEATQQRIFEPFFTTKGVGRGMGLGLASAYGIIKNHGGFIAVYSKKGKGTTFSIYLPASKKEAIEKRLPSEKISRGKGTVMFVDDEQMILEVGSEMLKRLGYRLLTARNGEEAIDIYRENKEEIDIVLLDMIMPGMNGGETYERLREIDPDIKVLLSSGYSYNDQATRIIERGCDGFIQKPFSLEELSQRIQEVLSK